MPITQTNPSKFLQIGSNQIFAISQKRELHKIYLSALTNETENEEMMKLVADVNRKGLNYAFVTDTDSAGSASLLILESISPIQEKLGR